MAYRVLLVEHLKVGKSITDKFSKKENVAYVGTKEFLSDLVDEYVKESKVYVTELNIGPPYVCKLL